MSDYRYDILVLNYKMLRDSVTVIVTTQSAFESLTSGQFLFPGRGFSDRVVCRSDLEKVGGLSPTYTLASAEPMIAPFLTPVSSSTKVALPLAEPRLHRQFADLRTNGDYGLFMQRWGWLAEPHVLKQTDVSNPSRAVYGESLQVWKLEAATVWAMIQIFDMVNNGSAGELYRYIEWQPDRVSIGYSVVERSNQFELLPKAEWEQMRSNREIDVGGNAKTITGMTRQVVASFSNPDVFSAMEHGSFLDPIAQHLSKVIGDKLAGRVSPRIFASRKFEWYLIPRDLRTVIWLQFMREFCGVTLVSRCRFCDKWITGKRKSRKYCDDVCRQAEHRRRARASNHT